MPLVSLENLEKGKLYVYHSENSKLAYVFDNCAQAARELTPNRCAHLSDLELNKNKNLQHIRRIINKGTLTTTEIGKFYLFQNPGYSNSLALVA